MWEGDGERNHRNARRNDAPAMIIVIPVVLRLCEGLRGVVLVVCDKDSSAAAWLVRKLREKYKENPSRFLAECEGVATA